uniref:Cyclic nucleotide-binding domain-containing protein n=1 Tax=Amphora coffeiformis TaxID=265554 RepID=A0A7S3P3U7_9STRA|mmetsp:Transcript_6868/g.13216  ORF Transcript_6868/g.13216 Transcript_6868/m.13216 type:complete len:541 (+) Transcript_6868:158-1780(+)|eukprot:scaffold1390_cov172-Amphora_coffeaeformis.AAC.3
MTTEDEAFKILKASPWFEEVSDALVHRIAAVAQPVHAVEGQIFVEEGKPIEDIIVLESGSLIRTRLAKSDPKELKASRNSIRHLRHDSRMEVILETSVVVDTLEGKGRVSGLLHSIRPGKASFATVTAKGNDTKLWLIKASDFRAIIGESPDYAMDIMAAMARELRTGTKSLRGLMEATHSHDQSASYDPNVPKMRVMCYDATSWTSTGFGDALKRWNKEHSSDLYIDMQFTTERLSENTATFAAGFDAVCLFVNDDASVEVLRTLSLLGVRMIAMRCAGFDRVDTKAAKAFGMTVARVPAYSPYAVAEMAVALLMAVNRKTHHASNRVKMANFTLDAGLMGIDIHGKTVGVMGTGKIGQIMCDIMIGFGVNLLCFDPYENQGIKDKGGKYVSLDEIYAQSDILMLAMPLMKPTYHTINEDMLHKLKPGVIIINTSRGGLVDTKALLKGLKSGVIGGVGMDVYENESEYFFQDWSAKHIKDEDLMSLLGNNNVVLTAHQAFFTKEAVNQIVNTTLSNLLDYQSGKRSLEHPNNCIPADSA